MICRPQSLRLPRTSAVVLMLALLLNVNVHIFTHIGDAMTWQLAVESSDHSEPESDPSLSGDHDCLGCQSLQHLLANSAAILSPIVVTAKAKIGWQQLGSFAYDPARATSGRAPPFA